jgi:cation transport regulator ChaB
MKNVRYASVADILRKIAADIPYGIQTPLSRSLQELQQTIGGHAWRKLSVEDLYKTIVDAAEKVRGHGLSENAYEKFKAALDSAGSSKEKLVWVATQYLLAGAGLKAVKAEEI